MQNTPFMDLSGDYSNLFTRIENLISQIIITNYNETEFQRIDWIRTLLHLKAKATQRAGQYQRAAQFIFIQWHLHVFGIKHLDSRSTESLNTSTTQTLDNNQFLTVCKIWPQQNLFWMPAIWQNATLSSSTLTSWTTQFPQKMALQPYSSNFDRADLSFGEFTRYASDIHNKDLILSDIDNDSELWYNISIFFHFITCTQDYKALSNIDQGSAFELFEHARNELELNFYTRKPVNKLLWQSKLHKFAHVTIDKPLQKRKTHLPPFKYGYLGFGTQESPIIIEDDDNSGLWDNPIFISKDNTLLPNSFSIPHLNLQFWTRSQIWIGFDGNLWVVQKLINFREIDLSKGVLLRLHISYTHRTYSFHICARHILSYVWYMLEYLFHFCCAAQ